MFYLILFQQRYVQDFLVQNSQLVYSHLIERKGHFYVCGDVSMAEDVCRTLKLLLQENGLEEPEQALINLRVSDEWSPSTLEIHSLYSSFSTYHLSPSLYILILIQESMRFHEDIFGITLRTAEVTRRGRTEALSKRSPSSSSS